MAVTEQPDELSRWGRVQALVHAIQHEDEDMVRRLVALSRLRRAFAPLALIVGALAMLLHGLRLLLTNWRLGAVDTAPPAAVAV